MDVEAAVLGLKTTLLRLGSRERAASEKRYLKSELVFLGTGVPAIRREAKAFVRAHKDELDRGALRELAQALWRTDVHELRALAVAVLELRVATLGPRDAGWLLVLVRESRTWALVDWLATKVFGPLVAREPALARKLDIWARDKDFWVRRTALLALHDPLLAGAGDFDHFARLALPMLGDPEFFIRKAIGWVLRSTSKRTPERTYAFVKQHARELSGLSFREAVRLLPAKARRELERVREAGG